MLALNRKYANALWHNNFPATPSNNPPGTRLTGNATPHDKGAYATLVTTTYDCYGFYVCCSNSFAGATQTDQLLDIAIGPNQENVIVPTWPCGWRDLITISMTAQYFPIFVPRGTLVSARIQSLITVDTVDVTFIGVEGASANPVPMFSGCDAYGVSIAASQGTSHTPGNTGAESTAADIGSTLSKHYGAVMFTVQGTLTNTTMTIMTYHWELVVGGGTICEWMQASHTSEAVRGPIPAAPYYMSLPSGTQLQVRGEASGTAQAHDVCFHCFY